jgi:hypothetical protein
MLQSAGSIGRLIDVVVVSDGCAALLHARDIKTFYPWNELRQMLVMTTI